MSLKVREKTGVIQILRRAPLDLREGEHPWQKHILQMALFAYVLGPEVCLHSLDSALGFGGYTLEGVELVNGFQAYIAADA